MLSRLLVKTQGVIKIDDGAAKALLRNGKSLLPSGIVSVKDDFGVRAPVIFQNRRNETLGVGLVNYCSVDIRKIMGLWFQLSTNTKLQITNNGFSIMRIGLFGGTFNPVHLGHLRAAVEVKEGFQLDEVFLNKFRTFQ